MVPVQNQELDASELHEFLQKIGVESKLKITAVNTGLAKGIDLGSNDFETLSKPKVGILVGKGVRSYDAGEIWHLLDTRCEMKLTKIDIDYFDSVDLGNYNDLIVPSINDKALSKIQIDKLKDWVIAGGTLIGYRESFELFHKKGLIKLELKKDTLMAKNISFGQKNDFKNAQETSGAIFETRLDLSHPINYGYQHNRLPMFRNTNIYIKPTKTVIITPFSTPTTL